MCNVEKKNIHIFADESSEANEATTGEVVDENESFLGKIKRKLFGWSTHDGEQGSQEFQKMFYPIPQ